MGLGSRRDFSDARRECALSLAASARFLTITSCLTRFSPASPPSLSVIGCDGAQPDEARRGTPDGRYRPRRPAAVLPCLRRLPLAGVCACVFMCVCVYATPGRCGAFSRCVCMCLRACHVCARFATACAPAPASWWCWVSAYRCACEVCAGACSCALIFPMVKRRISLRTFLMYAHGCSLTHTFSL